LSETVGQLLDATLDMVGALHGFVALGGSGQQAVQVQVGRGMWDSDLPLDLDELVRITGEPVVGGPGSAGEGLRHIVVPVQVDGEMVGSAGVVLAGGSPDGGPVDTEAEDRGVWEMVAGLKRFARLVAVAYAGANLLTTERAAREQEKALIRAGQALSSTLELRDVLHRILSELQKVVPYDTASVQELRGDQMVIVGGHGIDMEVFAGVGFSVEGDGVPNADVLRRAAPVIVPDILGDHPYHQFPHDAHEMSGVRGWLGVPLLFGNECIGMITLDTFAPDFYSDDHADVAMAFAAQAAIALQNARSFDRVQREVGERRRAEAELRRANEDLRVRMAEIEALQDDLRVQAERDALTGLYNRRYLIEVLPSEVKRSALSGRPLVLVMIDVDHFKGVNDTYGHSVGDEVLVALSSVLSRRTRQGDVACRYGGEEFVVVMPGVDAATGLDRAESWRRELASTPLGSTGEIRVTMSAGLAAAEPGDDAETLLRRADAAMYRAKQAGRDRVETARP